MFSIETGDGKRVTGITPTLMLVGTKDYDTLIEESGMEDTALLARALAETLEEGKEFTEPLSPQSQRRRVLLHHRMLTINGTGHTSPEVCRYARFMEILGDAHLMGHLKNALDRCKQAGKPQ